MKVIRKSLKSRILKQLSAVSLVAALALAAMLTPQLVSAQAAPEESESHGKGLQGTWKVTVQPYNCETGDPIGNPFASKLTFSHDGTMTGTTSSPAFLPGQRSPDFGIWSHTHGHTFNAVSEAFILFDSESPPFILSRPLPPPPFPRFHIGTQRISQEIEVSDDKLTSEALTQFFDSNGNLLSSNCANATAERVTTTEDMDSHEDAQDKE